MRKSEKRNPKDWTKIDVKRETKKRLRIKKEEMGHKTVDELIIKLLKKFGNKKK